MNPLTYTLPPEVEQEFDKEFKKHFPRFPNNHPDCEGGDYCSVCKPLVELSDEIAVENEQFRNIKSFIARVIAEEVEKARVEQRECEHEWEYHCGDDDCDIMVCKKCSKEK